MGQGGSGGGLLGSWVGNAVEILPTRWRWAGASSPSHPGKHCEPRGVWRTNRSIHHVRIPGLGDGYLTTTEVTKAALTLWPLLGPFTRLALVGGRGKCYYHIHFCVHLWFHLSAFMEPGLGTQMSNIRSLPSGSSKVGKKANRPLAHSDNCWTRSLPSRVAGVVRCVQGRAGQAWLGR